MPIELSYVLITPYSLQKSRTGGIIARLLSRTDLELVGTRLFTPTQEFTENYAKFIRECNDDTAQPATLEMISNYVRDNFMPYEGRYQRVMMLLFKGDNARKKMFQIVGSIKPGIRTGETIRDTYSDLIFNRDGSIRYFEPAVIVSPILSNKADIVAEMNMFASFFDTQPNIIDKPIHLCEDDAENRTLVMIKPDNWRYPSSRPGNIIDMLSRTGLRIVGCKLYKMSVEEALEFYGPVKTALREKLSKRIADKAKALIEKELDIKLLDTDLDTLAHSVGTRFADDQFSRIVEFMTGIRPEAISKDEIAKQGIVKCMVLIYQGKNAVDKIRDVLGPTDPTKAPGGTIRREFGTDVMVNTAHASDSFENAKREMRIVKVDINPISSLIRDYFKNS